MPTLGLNHINLSGTRDLLDALKDFYCDVIGLDVGARPNFPRFGYWLYAGGHPVVHLYESAPNEARKTDVLTTFDHVAFTCEDSAGFEALLRRRGVEYSKAIVPGTDQVQLFLTDPAGIKVELNFPALRPAVTLPVEVYTREREKEFDAAEAELAAALARRKRKR